MVIQLFFEQSVHYKDFMVDRMAREILAHSFWRHFARISSHNNQGGT